MSYITLDNLMIGDKAEVKKIKTDNSICRRFLDMGIVPGSKIECIMKSPGGDPVAYLIKGALIAIRNDDAKNILINRLGSNNYE